MKIIYLFIILLTSTFILTSCIKKSNKSQFVEGGLYASPRENKQGYNIIKILKIDNNGYHIRIYSNIFVNIPPDIDVSKLYMAGMERKEGEDLGMGHLPLSKANFENYQLIFIKKVAVLEDELDGYKMWAEANGGYF